MSSESDGQNINSQIDLLSKHELLSEIGALTSHAGHLNNTLNATRDEYDILRRRLEIVWEVVRVETMKDKLEKVAEVLWPASELSINRPTSIELLTADTLFRDVEILVAEMRRVCAASGVELGDWNRFIDEWIARVQAWRDSNL